MVRSVGEKDFRSQETAHRLKPQKNTPHQPSFRLFNNTYQTLTPLVSALAYALGSMCVLTGTTGMVTFPRWEKITLSLTVLCTFLSQ